MRISDWSSDVCSSDLVMMAATEIAPDDVRILVEPGYAIAPGCVAVGFELDDQVAIRHQPGAVPVHEAVGHRVLDRRKLRVVDRSEERSVGKEGLRTCRYGWAPYH